MYLRISLELPLKKLIAGGFEKVFEIGRIFRNEGNDPTHLQEYTQIEWYWAYSNYYDAMPFVAKIYRRIAEELLGTLNQIDYQGNLINWGDWTSEKEAKKLNWQVYNGWPAIPYFEAVRHFSKTYYPGGEVDLEGKNYDELLEIASKHKIEIEKGTSISNLMDKIYKKVARPFMLNPMFLIQQPVELEPLAKRDPKNPNLVHRWQIIAGGAELGKCFSELNDPIDQYNRFVEQQKARDNGDEEAQFMNEDYVKALEYGLPPLSGFGMSERLVSFLLGKHIRECVTFPAIRSEDNQASKAKKTLVAHAVILNSEDIPLWSKLNAAAHLSASFSAREGKKLIWMDETVTADGEKIPMNIQHAIVMKQAKKRADLLNLKLKAEKEGLVVSCFTEEMRDSSNDAKVKIAQENKKAIEIGWLGVLVFGEKKLVESLTEDLEMFS
jgi:lysyl-tRNA synthetase class 2